MPIRSKFRNKYKSRIKSKRLHKKKSKRISKLKKQTRKRYRKSNKRNNRRRKKTNRRYKKSNKQKGGFYFGTGSDVNKKKVYDMNDVLNRYFNHIFKKNVVTIEPLGSEGIYGIIFVVKFDPVFLQSISDTDFVLRDYRLKPCKRFLLKICYIDPNIRGIGMQHERDIGYGNDAKKVVSKEAFDYEVKIQQRVFNKTNSHLQPITPLIYHNAVHNSDDSKKLLDLLRNSANQSARPKLEKIRSLFGAFNRLNLGFIFMEMRDGYGTVMDLEEKTPGYTDTGLFLGMTGEVLNRLHNTCKVTHGDLHKANVLINTQEKSYYSPIEGNILLIDWGRSRIHNNGVIGTQEIPIPRNEAAIELEAVGSDWWSYRWLNTPREYYDGPRPGRDGHAWDNDNVKQAALELKKGRVPNYTESLDRIPGYFYQPANIACQYKPTETCPAEFWKKSCD